MLDMAKKDILPAVSSYVRELADTALSKKALSDTIPCDVEIELAEKLSKLLSCFAKKIAALEEALIKAKDVEGAQELADYYQQVVFAAMSELRAVGDEMEVNVSAEYWPYPSYGDMLFSV